MNPPLNLSRADSTRLARPIRAPSRRRPPSSLAALLLLSFASPTLFPHAMNAMNPVTNHHVITFSFCRLHFEYPVDLTPSPDFVYQQLPTEVADNAIRWSTPSAARPFVSMYSDLPGGEDGRGLATVAVEMWLCAAPAGFAGDVRRTADLRQANIELDHAENVAVSELADTDIQGETWLYRAAGRNYLIGLTRRIYLAARVSVVGARDNPPALEQAAAIRDVIIGSLRIERIDRPELAAGLQP